MSSFLSKLSFRKMDSKPTERRATWLELFFDLAFVVAIAKVTHATTAMNAHIDWFLPIVGGGSILIVWIQSVFYTNRFSAEDGLHRFNLLVQMFAVAMIATSFSRHGGEFDTTRFLIGLITSRVCLLAMYGRVLATVPDARTLAGGIMTYSIVTLGAVWLGLYYFGDWLIYAALLADFALPLALRPILAGSGAKLSGQHLIERFGLLIVLVIGESISSLFNHQRPEGTTVADWLFIATGLIAIGTLSWTYFRNMDQKVGEGRFGLVIAWEITHVVLVASIFGIAVSISNLLVQNFFSSLLLYSFALSFTALGLLHFWCYLNSPHRAALVQSAVRVVSAAAASAIAWFELSHSRFAPLVVVAVLSTLQLIADELLD